MKSAMQELIEWTEKYEGKMISADQVVLKAHNLLTKEKEQIQEAHKSGGYEMFTRTSKEYYNQTYNQDRITISETKRSIEGIGLLKKQSEGVEWWWKNQNL